VLDPSVQVDYEAARRVIEVLHNWRTQCNVREPRDEDMSSIGKRDVAIIVTQAYGPRGDSLVGLSEVCFDGYPAVTVKVRFAGQEALVHLSPVFGDSRKACAVDVPNGTRCELLCPVSGQALDLVGTHHGTAADYFAVYLTPKLAQGEMVAISNVWGDYGSRLLDSFEVLQRFSDEEE